ncbi:MAG TPA: nuclear transport factor 2 family protein [Pyrinomonadaceae bacterium]|jgi:ketosteroid isomerase-like protein|nr:nuclear transport factor 2 family protein [Pyrinomonadaceae bacterium]
MSEPENLQTVQSLFAAFGRGDVPALLGALAEDVQWIISGPEVVPYFGDWQGHAGVTDFLVQIGTAVAFERFEPQEFIARDEKVIVLGSERGRVKATGRTFDNDWAIAFTLRAGKISRVRIYDNTDAVAQAFRA